VSAIQDQSDEQEEGIDDATLDRVPDHTSIESLQPTVRGEPRRVLGLFDPPDEETGDDEVGHEGHSEQGRSDVLDSCGEGGLAGSEVGEFPDRHCD